MAAFIGGPIGGQTDASANVSPTSDGAYGCSTMRDSWPRSPMAIWYGAR